MGVLHSSRWPFSLPLSASSKVLQLKFLAYFYESFSRPRQTFSTNEIPFDTNTYDSLPTENEKLYLSHNGTENSKNKFYHFEVLLCVYSQRRLWTNTSNNESFAFIMIFCKKWGFLKHNNTVLRNSGFISFNIKIYFIKGFSLWEPFGVGANASEF